jgi:hypothetical protein
VKIDKIEKIMKKVTQLLEENGGCLIVPPEDYFVSGPYRVNE